MVLGWLHPQQQECELASPHIFVDQGSREPRLEVESGIASRCGLVVEHLPRIPQEVLGCGSVVEYLPRNLPVRGWGDSVVVA